MSNKFYQIIQSFIQNYQWIAKTDFIYNSDFYYYYYYYYYW